jgi:acyl-CoA reductase-like NAD-dependent aldehyde dehydrogenase
MSREFGLSINGEWVPGQATHEIPSPWDGSTVGVVQMAGPKELEAATQAAVRATSVMAGLPAWRRREILDGIVSGLLARHEEMATAICDEAGKPIQYARGETTRATQTFRFASEEAGRLAEGSIDLGAVPTGEGRFGIVKRVPIGPVAAISPFNFPLNLVAHKVAPAIAAGCPVVLKPASQTPMAALILADICREAGLPPGGLNVVPCDRKTADPLTTDDRFKLLSFTGSPGVGWRMKDRAGRKKVVLELGGNAAAIVHDDADLDHVVPRLAIGGFAYAGQVCISVQRILVHSALYDRFREAYAAEVSDNLPVGDPAGDEVVCGPLIDAKNADRVQTWVAEAVTGGASVIAGGERDGNLVQPIVLEGVDPAARVQKEEVFGPVVILERYDSEDEAIAKVNASDFGLQAGVFTDRLSFVWRCFEELEVGGVIHNDYPTFRVDHMPYGGVKDSGFGREGIHYAMEDYTERRLLAVRSGIR